MNTQNAIRINEVLAKAGLNWDALEEAIHTASGLIIPNKKAIVREDNKAVIGVVGDGYHPFQNSAMAELLLDMAANVNAPFHKGGYFANGARVYLQFKTEDTYLSYGDKVEGFLTAINSFDGSKPLAFGLSNITISCQNTFNMAFRGLKTRAKHTISMPYAVSELVREFEAAHAEQRDFYQTIKRLANAPITAEAKAIINADFFGIKDAQEISTRKENQMMAYLADLRTEVATKGETLWGLFSGLTRYTTHTDGSNEEAKMLGNVAERTQRVFAKFENLVA